MLTIKYCIIKYSPIYYDHWLFSQNVYGDNHVSSKGDCLSSGSCSLYGNLTSRISNDFTGFFYTGVDANKSVSWRNRRSIPDKERFAVQDDTPDASLPPANSGMLSVHPFFSLWTSSRHAVLCSPNQQKQNGIRFMISMSFYAKPCQGLQRNTVVGISLWCNCTYLQVRELFQLQFPLWSL